MIKFILFSLFWLTSIIACGQFAKDPLTIANTDFMQLSKEQKKKGWICLGSGTMLIGIAYFLWEKTGDDYSSSAFGLAITGLLCIPFGIRLLLLSSRNKRKAIDLSLRKETSRLLQNGSFSKHVIPSLSLKINI